MLNLVINVSGIVAIICNLFLLTVLFLVSKNKNDTESRIGFGFNFDKIIFFFSFSLYDILLEKRK